MGTTESALSKRRTTDEQSFAGGVDPAFDGSYQKWLTDTEPRRFPGWTVIAPVPRGSAAMDTLQGIVADLAADFGAGQFSRHPAASMHMTVFPGMNEAFSDSAREIPDWVRGGMTIPQISRAALARVEAAGLPEIGPVDIEVEDVAVDGNAKALLRPVEETRLREFRDLIAEATGWRRVDHDEYVFHVSLGYQLKDHELPEERRHELAAGYAARLKELGTITLDRPAFSVFDGMVSFPPILEF